MTNENRSLPIYYTKRRQLVDERVVVAGAEQTGREDDRVERHVVFGHELEQLHLRGRLPPALPLGRVVGRDRQVPDRRVEPHVEHLRAARK